MGHVSTNTAVRFSSKLYHGQQRPIQDTVSVDFGSVGDYKVEIITNEVTWTSDDST